jgi:hypothetical protein
MIQPEKLALKKKDAIVVAHAVGIFSSINEKIYAVSLVDTVSADIAAKAAHSTITIVCDVYCGVCINIYLRVNTSGPLAMDVIDHAIILYNEAYTTVEKIELSVEEAEMVVRIAIRTIVKAYCEVYAVAKASLVSAMDATTAAHDAVTNAPGVYRVVFTAIFTAAKTAGASADDAGLVAKIAGHIIIEIHRCIYAAAEANSALKVYAALAARNATTDAASICRTIYASIYTAVKTADASLDGANRTAMMLLILSLMSIMRSTLLLQQKLLPWLPIIQ